MWKWCLNSDKAALQLLVEGSRKCWMGQVGIQQVGILESNLHVCGEDDTKRAVYNMEECIEKKGSELQNNWYLEENLMK